MKIGLMSGLILGIAISFSVDTYAVPLRVIKAHVEFLAIGKPSAIKIRGKGNDLKSDINLDENEVTGKFVFNLDSLDTGIELRNTHMREKYLETAKFKYAELELKPTTLTSNPCKEPLKVEKVPFEGIFNLHGVQQPLKGEFDVSSKSGLGHSQIRFKLNLSDYNIRLPEYLGVKVADKIENTIDLDWTCPQ